MRELIARLRAEAAVRGEVQARKLNTLADDLTFQWTTATTAQDMHTFQTAMKQVAGLWARAVNDYREITGRLAMPAKPRL